MFFLGLPIAAALMASSSDANAAPDAQREMPPGGRLRKSSAFHRSATILKFVVVWKCWRGVTPHLVSIQSPSGPSPSSLHVSLHPWTLLHRSLQDASCSLAARVANVTRDAGTAGAEAQVARIAIASAVVFFSAAVFFSADVGNAE